MAEWPRDRHAVRHHASREREQAVNGPNEHADILCEACGTFGSRVIDTRCAPVAGQIGRAIRRRRACQTCRHRWSTYEITDARALLDALAVYAGDAAQLAADLRRLAASRKMPVASNC